MSSLISNGIIISLAIVPQDNSFTEKLATNKFTTHSHTVDMLFLLVLQGFQIGHFLQMFTPEWGQCRVHLVKVVLLTYKRLGNILYTVCDLIKPHITIRPLGSQGEVYLTVSRFNKMHLECSFHDRRASVSLWFAGTIVASIIYAKNMYFYVNYYCIVWSVCVCVCVCVRAHAHVRASVRIKPRVLENRMAESHMRLTHNNQPN